MVVLLRKLVVGWAAALIARILWRHLAMVFPAWALRLAVLFVAQIVIAHILGIPSLDDIAVDLAVAGYTRIF